jgi:hypothetical protein
VVGSGLTTARLTQARGVTKSLEEQGMPDEPTWTDEQLNQWAGGEFGEDLSNWMPLWTICPAPWPRSFPSPSSPRRSSNFSGTEAVPGRSAKATFGF